MQAKQLVCAAVASLDRHKAEDICTLRVDEVSSLAEYFVIVQGTSTTHVRALCDYVQDELKLIDQYGTVTVYAPLINDEEGIPLDDFLAAREAYIHDHE